MAASRQETLRQIEKLLSQGRLDGAIAEYAQIVEQHPNEWATTSAVWDLYVRASRIDQAIAQYARIADHFLHKRFFPKVVVLYKRILKVKPGEEAAQLQLAEASVKQGLLVDARGYLCGDVEQRRQRGDLRAADEIVVRMAELEPGDVEPGLAGAKALVRRSPGWRALPRCPRRRLKLTARGCTRSGRHWRRWEKPRGLAALLGLQTEAGEYPDVAKRVERLSGVETGS